MDGPGDKHGWKDEWKDGWMGGWIEYGSNMLGVLKTWDLEDDLWTFIGWILLNVNESFNQGLVYSLSTY